MTPTNGRYFPGTGTKYRESYIGNLACESETVDSRYKKKLA